MTDTLSRRSFVEHMIAGGSSSLLLARMPYLADASAWSASRQQAGDGAFLFLSAEQAAEISAVCERILPTDDTPGAREAGVIYFIDYVLSKYEPENRQAYADGLQTLAAAAKAHGADRFSALAADQQIQVLTALEKSEFFGLVRQHTILGFLGDPKHKGNRGEVGWKYIGFDHQPMYQPPFGYYDREAGGDKPPQP